MDLLLFEETNQAEKDFSGIDINDITLEGKDFHESIFNGVYFHNVTFINCNLKNTEFTEARLMKCSFINTSMDNSDFVYTDIHDTYFEKCSFSHVEWRESTLGDVNFKECAFYNSTISLCSFNKTFFDLISSDSFCGSSKRFNVFKETNILLGDNQIAFLKSNYGITSPQSTLLLNDEHQRDPFMNLSVQKYNGQLSTANFVELIIEGASTLSGKNSFQKAKYLSLICKRTIEENKTSIFGQQLIINSLNSICKKITESLIFMELVDLIMFVKTYQYQSISQNETEVKYLDNYYPKQVTCQFFFDNSYSKAQVENYLRQMVYFIGIDYRDVQLVEYKRGSTIFQIVIQLSVSLGTLLLFINFSLAQVSKTFKHLTEIKKSVKNLIGGDKENPTKDPNQPQALMPIAIMQNQGNIYYGQINNTTNHFGKEIVNLDGAANVHLVINDRNIENSVKKAS